MEVLSARMKGLRITGRPGPIYQQPIYFQKSIGFNTFLILLVFRGKQRWCLGDRGNEISLECALLQVLVDTLIGSRIVGYRQKLKCFIFVQHIFLFNRELHTYFGHYRLSFLDQPFALVYTLKV